MTCILQEVLNEILTKQAARGNISVNIPKKCSFTYEKLKNCI